MERNSTKERKRFLWLNHKTRGETFLWQLKNIPRLLPHIRNCNSESKVAELLVMCCGWFNQPKSVLNFLQQNQIKFALSSLSLYTFRISWKEFPAPLAFLFNFCLLKSSLTCQHLLLCGMFRSPIRRRWVKLHLVDVLLEETRDR